MWKIEESLGRRPYRDVGARNMDAQRQKMMTRGAPQARRQDNQVPRELRYLLNAKGADLDLAASQVINVLQTAGIFEWLKMYPKMAMTGVDSAQMAAYGMQAGDWGPFLQTLPEVLKLIPFGILSGSLIPLPIPKPWAWLFWAYVMWSRLHPEEPAARFMWKYLAPDRFNPERESRIDNIKRQVSSTE